MINVQGMKIARLVVAAVALASTALQESAAGQVSRAEQRQIREALLEELRPVALKNCTVKRYGGANDGGYLLCENLIAGLQSAYSHGLDTEDNWGCQLFREFGIPVHQYDCFTRHRPSCQGGKTVFHNECIGPKKATIDSRPFDTLANQISRNGDAGK
jgi:hypothetical protein